MLFVKFKIILLYDIFLNLLLHCYNVFLIFMGFYQRLLFNRSALLFFTSLCLILENDKVGDRASGRLKHFCKITSVKID